MQPMLAFHRFAILELNKYFLLYTLNVFKYFTTIDTKRKNKRTILNIPLKPNHLFSHYMHLKTKIKILFVTFVKLIF